MRRRCGRWRTMTCSGVVMRVAADLLLQLLELVVLLILLLQLLIVQRQQMLLMVLLKRHGRSGGRRHRRVARRLAVQHRLHGRVPGLRARRRRRVVTERCQSVVVPSLSAAVWTLRLPHRREFNRRGTASDARHELYGYFVHRADDADRPSENPVVITSSTTFSYPVSRRT